MQKCQRSVKGKEVIFNGASKSKAMVVRPLLGRAEELERSEFRDRRDDLQVVVTEEQESLSRRINAAVASDGVEEIIWSSFRTFQEETNH
jgi:hypothetical protein